MKRKLDEDVWEIDRVQALLKHAAAGRSAEEVRIRMAWACLNSMPYWQARELGLQDHSSVLTRAAEAIEAGAWRGAK